ncbi:MAG: methionyl-tRNA formyltransferase [bacterium]
MSKIKIVFIGTPDFAVPYLNSILADADFEVLGVITQSDKPSGRKQELTPSAVKISAEKNNLTIWQPENIKNNPELIQTLKNLQPDLLVVVAYGQIIPQEILDIATHGNINVHPSLLPKYRGASPIQSALLAGETETGISIMLMDAKMDHGPILTQEKIKLLGEETNKSLHDDLAQIGAPILINTIKKYLHQEITPTEQNHAEATFCKTISKTDAQINWSLPAKKIKQKIYAFYPWPGTWTTLDNKRVKIFPPVQIKKINSTDKKTGQIILENKKLATMCGEDFLIINNLQLEGGKEMSAENFLAGHQDIEGKFFI